MELTIQTLKDHFNLLIDGHEWRKEGVRFEFGGFDFEKISKAELIVMSPGVSSFRFSEFRELKREVISEIELAYRFFKGKLIVITRTNGKSTTTTLVHHLFSTAGRKGYLLEISVTHLSLLKAVLSGIKFLVLIGEATSKICAQLNGRVAKFKKTISGGV